jgi:hypothetical protein
MTVNTFDFALAAKRGSGACRRSETDQGPIDLGIEHAVYAGGRRAAPGRTPMTWRATSR